MLKFSYCKLLETPRYTNKDIIVFRNAVFYNYKTNNIISKRRKSGKRYTTIFTSNNNGNKTTMIVPYIICYLFKNDYLKHGENEKNYFEYLDGDLDNCSADNIRANYYSYDIVRYMSKDILVANICDYEILLNEEFYLNALHRYNFRPVRNNNIVYFVSENTGRNIRLHQAVMKYYYPNEMLTGVIDHYNHNTLDNTIENLKHTNHIINSMNNFNIRPQWNEDKQCWKIRYRVDGVGHSKSFSVYKYKSKENAYDNSIKYINDIVLPLKSEYLKKKDYLLKVKEFDNLIKYFLDSNNTSVIFEILNNYNIINEKE